jgi:hypothetical protein
MVFNSRRGLDTVVHVFTIREQGVLIPDESVLGATLRIDDRPQLVSDEL